MDSCTHIFNSYEGIVQRRAWFELMQNEEQRYQQDKEAIRVRAESEMQIIERQFDEEESKVSRELKDLTAHVSKVREVVNDHKDIAVLHDVLQFLEKKKDSAAADLELVWSRYDKAVDNIKDQESQEMCALDTGKSITTHNVAVCSQLLSLMYMSSRVQRHRVQRHRRLS